MFKRVKPNILVPSVGSVLGDQTASIPDTSGLSPLQKCAFDTLISLMPESALPDNARAFYPFVVQGLKSKIAATKDEDILKSLVFIQEKVNSVLSEFESSDNWKAEG